MAQQTLPVLGHGVHLKEKIGIPGVEDSRSDRRRLKTELYRRRAREDMHMHIGMHILIHLHAYSFIRGGLLSCDFELRRYHNTTYPVCQ